MPWWVCLHGLHQQAPLFFDVEAWEGQRHLTGDLGSEWWAMTAVKKTAGHPGFSGSLKYLQATQAFSESLMLGDTGAI